ncbi:poly-gamma-glutamate capsule biosynthesis protein CapA/YwtB (metallophosphatase superfamily) [Saccharothrix tamanrassetensis]|uniref:Poly-gamma-glutamate capsule biosynthesis protein CapA/YwtB (Metallophosphatase superfamily) n=1 Tax=Saccharothrix tamanrassetensis TaxID=1051531 RepID=A0A841CWP8_9PSEU|nr:CapA family protein [Saccharothrix tamanrassetensis]MBB5960734.1 poly-gamma-glutamate capsule biosynthesis protein CapA/YwtB (metallophosphatase superfamily) [Saccharothrix tamanrassetensis]
MTALATDFRREEPLSERTLDTLRHAVRTAGADADVVVVSLHSHARRKDPRTPPEFLVRTCRDVVDSGAHVVVVHGPHVMRPIEFYRGGLICYGLGSLVLRPDDAAQPAEAYTTRGLRPGDGQGLTEHRLRELAASGEDCTALVVEVTVEDGTARRVELHPALLDTDPRSPSVGLPAPVAPAGMAAAKSTLGMLGAELTDLPRGILAALGRISASSRG